ncbi:MAG: hypothetical protein Q4F13_14090 [Pseudomonadota bacterium]|nr:hypothetical protein [Pseudomonadota bacterium]
MTEKFTRSAPFRAALWGGLSTGPVLAVLWPLFVRLESGVWPLSLVAHTVAMLTLGTVTGLGAALTLLLPVLSLLNVHTGPRLKWQAAAAGAGVCVLLVAGFGLMADAVRLGEQWPLWAVLVLTGAISGWLGGAMASRPRRASGAGGTAA